MRVPHTGAHVVRRHRDALWLHCNRLRVERRADRRAQHDGVVRAAHADAVHLAATGGARRVDGLHHHGVLAGGGDVDEALDVLDAALVGLLGPKEDGPVGALGRGVRARDGAGEGAPLVVRADVRKVDVRVDGEREAERAALPRARGDPRARHLQRAQVLPKRRVEEHHRHRLLRRVLVAGDREDRARRVPPDRRRERAGVHQDGRVVGVAAHQLQPAVFQTDRERRLVGVLQPLGAVVPVWRWWWWIGREKIAPKNCAPPHCAPPNCAARRRTSRCR